MGKNIKLTYSYDGSEFFGFQRQPGLRTVQGELEKVLKLVFKEDIDLISAGRTDRGVHGKIQVSNFVIDSTIPCERMERILNSRLPKDIVITDVEEVPLDFNSRFSAKHRGYEYFITEEKTPFNSRYTTFIDKKMDIDELNKIVAPLVGVHDFSNFRLADCSSKTTVREIYVAEFKRIDEKTVKLYVKGNSFLKSQIRIIVGTILSIYLKHKPENYLKEMLANPTKKYVKMVAEPFGLHLCEIEY
ncbi:tRNA pseudouridine(38-40) synthase TruA [Cetobacterium sp.]|uniref:tRNA pseudouridine(38-40) synthase TruA n=1 Tax=Cetobacterium sp. TaxID=2071632 RepID=UPI002FC62561